MPALLAEAARSGLSRTVREPDSSIAVLVFAKDPISRAGVSGQLRSVTGMNILEPGDDRTAEVAVVVVDRVTDEVLRLIHTIRRNLPKVVVVAAVLDPPARAAATEAGVTTVLSRSEADHRQLAAAIRQAHFGDAAPALAPVSHPNFRRGWEKTAQGLTARDRDVLRYLAEGCDTAEIARQLAYSEPTIKNVIQRLFEQLQARNRPHAVAIALRAGII